MGIVAGIHVIMCIYIYIMYKNDGCLKLDSLSLVF